MLSTFMRSRRRSFCKRVCLLSQCAGWYVVIPPLSAENGLVVIVVVVVVVVGRVAAEVATGPLMKMLVLNCPPIGGVGWLFITRLDGVSALESQQEDDDAD